jgi:phosphoglycerate dehydrogenase-like enzyme
LRPFGVNTLALTRSGRSVPGADASVGPDSVDDLLRSSDYLILAAPDTSETRGLLDAKRLTLLRRSAAVINVGRGTIIDTNALVDALRNGRVRAAVLDVTDPEPLPERHPLWELPNALVTSHSASTPTLAGAAFVDRVRQNVERYCAGDPLLGLVDPQLGY